MSKHDAADVFANAVSTKANTRVSFRLYVAGTSERSIRAIQNARHLCDTALAGRADLEVIDIFQQPKRARLDQILAVPSLVRLVPLPVRRFVGDISNRTQILAELGIESEPT